MSEKEEIKRREKEEIEHQLGWRNNNNGEQKVDKI